MRIERSWNSNIYSSPTMHSFLKDFSEQLFLLLLVEVVQYVTRSGAVLDCAMLPVQAIQTSATYMKGKAEREGRTARSTEFITNCAILHTWKNKAPNLFLSQVMIRLWKSQAWRNQSPKQTNSNVTYTKAPAIISRGKNGEFSHCNFYCYFSLPLCGLYSETAVKRIGIGFAISQRAIREQVK